MWYGIIGIYVLGAVVSYVVGREYISIRFGSYTKSDKVFVLPSSLLSWIGMIMWVVADISHENELFDEDADW